MFPRRAYGPALTFAFLMVAAPARADDPPAKKPDAKEVPLDVAEPPFAKGDFTWMNGTNRQSESLLKVGPVNLSLIVDAYYLWSFHHPVDHTSFPSTTAPRHNEISLNMGSVGIELPPNAIDSKAGGPVGQFALQYGSMGETNFGQDRTLSRGFFLTKPAFLPIRAASAGWHFHWMHGANIEIGILPSYIALESYIPQENWNYLHPFVSDFTPYYFSGIRAQLHTSQNFKIEAWVVNGWQTFGQWHEGRAGGYLWNWRPTDRMSFTNTMYMGQEAAFDPKSLRWYTDNFAQFQYYRNSNKDAFLRSAAVCIVADLGYEYRGDGSRYGWRTGQSLTNRLEFMGNVALTFRGDTYYDPSQALVTSLPLESPYTRPAQDREFFGGGFTTTIDYLPSPWLLTRLEFMHRGASIPYFSGPGGITGPDGVAPTGTAAFVPDLRRYDNRLVANVTLRL